MKNILFTEHFKHQLKRLKKKYPHIKEDLLKSLETFSEENATSIKKNICKIRIKSSDMKKGKSGGYRSYIYLFRLADALVPICIYPKSSQENLTDNELQLHIEMSLREIH